RGHGRANPLGRSGGLRGVYRRRYPDGNGLMGADSESLLERVGLDDGIGPIARRYFVSNGFDGALTGVGVTVGAYLSGVPDGITVISIGLGAAVGLTTSGVWSVWEIERAEMRAEVQAVEDAMLADLSDTQVEREKSSAQVVNAVMSGLGPLIALVLTLLPFLFEGAVFSLLQATLVSIAV